jgi:hypothetical protein
MAPSCCSANTALRLLFWFSRDFCGDVGCGNMDCVCCCMLASDMALIPAEIDRICCSLSRASTSIGAIALPDIGWSGDLSITDATAVGDVDAAADDATLRALAARSAARRSIGVRSGPGAVIGGSVFSVLICGVDSGGVVTAVEFVSDCEVADEARGVSEGVGVTDAFFSVLMAKVVTRGSAEAGGGGVGSGSGTLGG